TLRSRMENPGPAAPEVDLVSHRRPMARFSCRPSACGSRSGSVVRLLEQRGGERRSEPDEGRVGRALLLSERKREARQRWHDGTPAATEPCCPLQCFNYAPSCASPFSPWLPARKKSLRSRRTVLDVRRRSA